MRAGTGREALTAKPHWVSLWPWEEKRVPAENVRRGKLGDGAKRRDRRGP